jgi:hypothetical protein
VDDNKISHEDPEVVDEVIEIIRTIFKDVTVKRGNKHTFVGIDFEVNMDGTVSLDMVDSLKESIVAFGEPITKNVPTPASSDLFTVKESPTLDEKRSEIFHHIVAKLLYVTKRVRVNISPTIAFLTTRVSKSTEQDWKKLKRLLEYISGTLDMKRTMGTDGLETLRTYVNASYAKHMDMRGHTGGIISLGKGIIHSKLSKHKINTKSSTEAELVGGSDFIPWTLWLRRILNEEG